MALILALAPVGASAVPAPSAKRTFDVPAGEAEATLREFSKQASVQLVFDVDKVQGVRTALVRGEFEPHDALNRMFAHTGLIAVKDEKSGALTIRRSTDPNG